MVNKQKLLILAVALFTAASSYATLKYGLDSDQIADLSNLIINLVSFLVGLFINPKKRK